MGCLQSQSRANFVLSLVGRSCGRTVFGGLTRRAIVIEMQKQSFHNCTGKLDFWWCLYTTWKIICAKQDNSLSPTKGWGPFRRDVKSDY